MRQHYQDCCYVNTVLSVPSVHSQIFRHIYSCGRNISLDLSRLRSFGRGREVWMTARGKALINAVRKLRRSAENDHVVQVTRGYQK